MLCIGLPKLNCKLSAFSVDPKIAKVTPVVISSNKALVVVPAAISAIVAEFCHEPLMLE